MYRPVLYWPALYKLAPGLYRPDSLQACWYRSAWTGLARQVYAMHIHTCQQGRRPVVVCPSIRKFGRILNNGLNKILAAKKTMAWTIALFLITIHFTKTIKFSWSGWFVTQDKKFWIKVMIENPGAKIVFWNNAKIDEFWFTAYFFIYSYRPNFLSDRPRNLLPRAGNRVSYYKSVVL